MTIKIEKLREFIDSVKELCRINNWSLHDDRVSGKDQWDEENRQFSKVEQALAELEDIKEV